MSVAICQGIDEPHDALRIELDDVNAPIVCPICGPWEPSVTVVRPPFGAPSGRYYVAIDVETTGLNPEIHDVVEIGAVVVDAVSLEELAACELLVEPSPDWQRICDPVAIELTDAAYRDGDRILPGCVPEILCVYLHGAAGLIGHHVAFDRSFLSALWHEHARWPLPEVIDDEGGRAGRLDVCTRQLAWPIVHAGQSSSRSLAPICEALGIQRRRPHHALSDARDCVDVLRAITRIHRAGWPLTL